MLNFGNPDKVAFHDVGKYGIPQIDPVTEYPQGEFMVLSSVSDAGAAGESGFFSGSCAVSDTGTEPLEAAGELSEPPPQAHRASSKLRLSSTDNNFFFILAFLLCFCGKHFADRTKTREIGQIHRLYTFILA